MIVYVLIEEFNAPSDGHGGRPVNVLGVYETEDLAKANCHKEIVRARTRGLLLPEDEEELADAGVVWEVDYLVEPHRVLTTVDRA